MLKPIVLLTTFLACLLVESKPMLAVEISAQLSTREAYVGAPILLQIELSNVKSHEAPELPKVAGLDIESAGPPSESSQITIINGRRSERQSVVYRFRITPKAAGEFTLPAFSVQADGRTFEIDPLDFVATKSETGDLLFVEIEGKQKEVFVGQSVELTLKIWIKPFRDAQRNIQLTEADMWRLISEQSSWGSFADRIQELTENRQRPGGEEVLRPDDAGNQHSYYLYQIDATVYPRKPGTIDARDLQIIVDYPIALGKARDPFADFFGSNGFGVDPRGNAPSLDDDFFSSPFRNRLTVKETRPVIAEAMLETIQVLPIPDEGRPDDYRGAVGRYRIVTKAEATTVKAGDPIELTMGITGTGPMELIQPPPLSELPELAGKFRVSEEPLAGFTQNDSKLFSAKIRPLDESVQEIPGIPFSYFDPDEKKFVTVRSEPIKIVVEKAEALALDRVVAAPAPSSSSTVAKTEENGLNVFAPPKVDFTNFTELPPNDQPLKVRWANPLGVALFVGPPLLFFTLMLRKYRQAVRQFLPSFRSATSRCLAALASANSADDLRQAIVTFILSRTQSTGKTQEDAVGELRLANAYPLAARCESFLAKCEANSSPALGVPTDSENVDSLRQESIALVQAIDHQLTESQRKIGRKRASNGNQPLASDRLSRSTPIILATLWTSSILSTACFAARSGTDEANHAPLTPVQVRQLFAEANATYQQALTESKGVSSQTKFQDAAAKYQVLVDSEVVSAELYFNLANAYFQAEEYGKAIANYHRAQAIAPLDGQITANLHAATEAAGLSNEETAALPNHFSQVWQKIYTTMLRVNQAIGFYWDFWLGAAAWLGLWSLLTLRLWKPQTPILGGTLMATSVLLLALGFQGLEAYLAKQTSNGVFLKDPVTLREGDGESFAEVGQITPATGRNVWILGSREGWTRLRTANGQTGWVRADSVAATR